MEALACLPSPVPLPRRGETPARGGDGKFVGCSWLAIPYVVLARPGIAKMEELRGKTVAASAPGTPPDIVARASLAAFKVPDTEVTFAAAASRQRRLSTFSSHLRRH